MKVRTVKNFTKYSGKRNHHFWLRSEVKTDEKRTLLLPKHVDELLKAGFKVTVEKCPQRCVPIEAYKDLDITIAEPGSWVDAPKDAVIVGLKELPEGDYPLVHSHIFFAHIYKGQFDAPKMFSRFRKGGGKLYDLEYLVDDTGRRIAAFGNSAGMAGAAIGALVWAWRKDGHTEPFPRVTTYEKYADLVEYVKGKLNGRKPKSVIVGGFGRVGSGATSMLQSIGAETEIWDHTHTTEKGPYLQLLDTDIFVNAILLSPTDEFIFLNRDCLSNSKKDPKRKLDTIVDISCDTNNPKNPIPLYKDLTSFSHPSKRLDDLGVDIIQIDHLPSLVPYESSKDFTGQLLPFLKEFDQDPVWKRALNIFDKKKEEYKNRE